MTQNTISNSSGATLRRTYYISALTKAELLMLQRYLQTYVDDDLPTLTEQLNELEHRHPPESASVDNGKNQARFAMIGLDADSHRACTAYLNWQRRPPLAALVHGDFSVEMPSLEQVQY